ncbi:MAG: protein phosphatase 2C domain-containing protein [Candidatus Omnitrophica bacterium]|nr:protein phosphatase 2C domain-containing protein [Candidatus Omnitrophota bacterium]
MSGNQAAWTAMGWSSRGETHIHRGLPNQDSIQIWRHGGKGQEVVVCVADGHGDPRSFRSKSGAQIATSTARSLIREYTKTFEGGANPPAWVVENLQSRLPRQLVWEWRNRVDGWLSKKPLDRELDVLEATHGQVARKQVETWPYLAYGTTFNCVLATEGFLFCLKIGDGDFLLVEGEGTVRRPFETQEPAIGEETFSLCMEDASNHFDSRFEVLKGNSPMLVVVSTDGYRKSFAHDTDFEKVGSDLFNLVQSRGLETVRRNLPAWLRETSTNGSGDDITLALVWRNGLPGSKPNALNPDSRR